MSNEREVINGKKGN